MLKGLLIAATMAFSFVAFSASAGEMPKWERALLARYVNHTPCNGAGAPAWGKASMQRWRAAQRHAKRYDAQ